MKRIFSGIATIALIWAILMFFDYIRAYNNGENLLITVKLEVTEEYTKKTGLGYSVIQYDYDKNSLYDGQVLKEFTIFGLTVSKEIAIINE